MQAEGEVAAMREASTQTPEMAVWVVVAKEAPQTELLEPQIQVEVEAEAVGVQAGKAQTAVLASS